MNIKHHLIGLTFLLVITSLPSHAGKIYRFLDKNGVSTLSKVLPPYAAQQGYDILDDKTYRVIEHVLTLEESSKINAEQARIAQEKEQQEQQKLKRLINDRSLLDRYPDDRVMIKARDTDLAFISKQIEDVKEHQQAKRDELHKLQQSAAEAELSGETVLPALEKSMAAARSEITNDTLHIKRLQDEYNQVKAQYKADLTRLRQLLNIPEPTEKNAAKAPVSESTPVLD